MSIMPKCEQFIYRPLIVPKIITTYHYSRQEAFQMEEKQKYEELINGSLTKTTDCKSDMCKCPKSDSNTPKSRCVCSSRSVMNRSPSPFRKSPSPFRRSPSPMAGYGYELYQKSLLEVPYIPEYGDASSDDLSSEWDSDVPDVPPPRPVHSKVSFYIHILLFRIYLFCLFISRQLQ